MTKDNYNYGISCLRIISMIFITILHIYGHGGLLASLTTPSQIAASQLLYTLAYCGVNCFAIISGFVGYKHDNQKVNYSRWLTLWFQVAFYSAGITLIFMILNHPDITLKQLILSCIPVTSYQYWYFTAYTGMILLMPLIHLIIKNTDKTKAIQIILTGTIFFSCYGFIANRYSNTFDLNHGYSVIWLCFLYYIGSTIKKYNLHKKVPVSYSIIILIASWLITYAWKIFVPNIIGNLSNLFITYLSPTMLAIAISLVLIFSNLQFKPKLEKGICLLNDSSFSIYLIQEENLIRTFAIINRFTFLATGTPYFIPIYVIGIAISIFTIGTLLDQIRVLVFKILHINELSNKIITFFMSIYDKTCDYIIKPLQ